MNLKHFSFMMSHAKETENDELENEIAEKFLKELRPPKTQASEEAIMIMCMNLLGIQKLKN